MSDITRPVASIPPLSTIKDTDTRRVLEAVVQGWRVRNGDLKPDSDQRFITKGELQNLVSDINSGYFAPGGPGNKLIDDVVKGGDIAKKVDDLLAATDQDILTSYIWAKLGERIPIEQIPDIFARTSNVETLVRRETTERKTADEAIVTDVTQLGARVGQNEAGLSNEVLLRTNSDNALATAVNTMWAKMGDNAALVQSGANGVTNRAGAVAEKWDQVQATISDPLTGNFVSTAAVRDEARASADKVTNRLTAERTIKVDVDGYVAGIGLIADKDLNTGATTSAVIVRADKFAVGSASTGNAVPFKVYTAYTVAPDGVTVIPPGVYINDAFIGNGTIGRAQIGVAQIDTLRLGGEAVIIPRFNEVVTSLGLTESWSDDVCYVDFTVSGLPASSSASVCVTAVLQSYPSNGTSTNLVVGIFANGSLNTEVGNTYAASGITTTNVGQFPVGNGTHRASIRVKCRATPGGATSKAGNTFFGKILVQTAKR